MNLRFNSEESTEYQSVLQAEPQPIRQTEIDPRLALETREMQTLSQRLRAKNPVKQIAQRYFAGKVEAGDVELLLFRLENNSANRWRERKLAAWILGAIPLNKSQKDLAAETLSRIVETSHKQDRLRTWGRFCYRSAGYFLSVALLFFLFAEFVRLYAPSLMGFWVFIASLGRTILDPYMHLWDKLIDPMMRNTGFIIKAFVIASLYILIPAPITLPLSLFIDRRNQNRVRATAATSLERLGELDALPALLSALRNSSGECFDAVAIAIKALLPNLTPEHFGTLRADVTPNLCYILENYKGGYTLEVLSAIEKVGDSRAIPTITRLINTTPDSDVRDKAKKILPILEARKELETHSSQLLRASQQPDATHDLLRPAREKQDSDPDTLLRPSDS